MTLGIALASIVGILAVLLPAPISSLPVAGIEVTKLPWMFWWPFTLENSLGSPAILWGELTFFVLLAALPFIDRNPNRLWRRRPVAMIVAAVVLMIFVTLTTLMAVTPTKVHL